MRSYDHLIVGGGMAGHAAAQAIREADGAASIGMLGEEPEGPYDRTALSKGLWRGADERGLGLDVERLGVELLPHRATAIDPARRTVLDSRGDEVGYRRLLLATGVRPRFLPFDLDGVHYLHSLAEYRRLRAEADKMVVAIGTAPRIELAWTAGLGSQEGVAVDEYLRTAVPAIYAAGDVANYPDAASGRRRVESADHALRSGRHAGLAMAGEGAPYRHLPSFSSQLLGHRYEAVGDLSPRLRAVAAWEEPYAKGVVYYLDEASRVRGVLAWNDAGRMDWAREVLTRGARLTQGGRTRQGRPAPQAACSAG